MRKINGLFKQIHTYKLAVARLQADLRLISQANRCLEEKRTKISNFEKVKQEPNDNDVYSESSDE